MQPQALLADRRADQARAWLQLIALAFSLILAAGILKIGAAPYVAFAFAGSLLIFLRSSPSRAELAATAVMGAAFALVYRLHGGAFQSYFASEIGTPTGFLGMGAVQMLVARFVRGTPEQRARDFRSVRDAALIPSLCIGSMIAVSLAAFLTPLTYDRVIYDFDLKFGTPPSWIFGALFRAQPWLFSLAGHAYNCLPLALSACILLDTPPSSLRTKTNVALAIVLLGVAGFALYQICPVSGPVYLFPHDFPSHIPAALPAMAAPLIQVARNGMPSLHVGWTLLLLWNLRKRPLFAAASFVLLLLTILATLGSGEHYLADLIVAPPLVLAVQAFSSRVRSSRQRWALILGTAATLAWLIAFRTGIALSVPAGTFTWMLAFLSTAFPVAVAYWAGV